MSLHEDLLAEPDPRERHRLKVEAYVALGERTRTITRGRSRITITGGLSEDVRGLLTFDVRVDRDGVDITPSDLNPVRIFNPPILVPDPAGPIVRIYTGRDGTVITRRFREDPEAALLGVIRDLLDTPGAVVRKR